MRGRRRRDGGRKTTSPFLLKPSAFHLKFGPKVFIAAECDPMHVKPVEKIPSSH